MQAAWRATQRGFNVLVAVKASNDGSTPGVDVGMWVGSGLGTCMRVYVCM
jgi:hypothetical protein